MGVTSRVGSHKERLRQAVEVALSGLSRVRETEQVRDLRAQGQRLLAEVESWDARSPRPEVRDEAVRKVAAMHVRVLTAMREAGPKEQPAVADVDPCVNG